MPVDIQRADWARDQRELLAIRVEVFVEEQGVPLQLEHDEHDAEALHLLALVDGEPVATARMLRDGHIGRMAVLRDYRGRGIGGQLLQTLIEEARSYGLDEVFLHAQCQAEEFYKRHGFVARGGTFLDAGIDHRTMVRRLVPPKRP